MKTQKGLLSTFASTCPSVTSRIGFASTIGRNRFVDYSVTCVTCIFSDT